MGPITSFEDIEVWQKARALARSIYQCCNVTRLGRGFGLRDQVQRAAVSVMANIAEGFGRGRNSEFIHYLKIAKGPCSELQSHLYVALDANLIKQEQFDELQQQARMTGKKLSAFIAYLQKSPKQAPQSEASE